MADLETVKVKSGDSFATINKSDYDPDVHELHEDNADLDLGDDDAEIKKIETRRQYDANRGVPTGTTLAADGRNPSGTYSEPTPTDIRYPNKDATEFENNHGAFVRKSAAQIREDQGMEDKPGGLIPEVHEKVQDAAAATAAAADVATEAEATVRDGSKTSTEGDLDGMTVSQLKDYAGTNDIDLAGATTKADIRAAIDKAGK